MAMSQSSLLIAGETPETGKRAQVLVPYPLSRAYDYLLPHDMSLQPGDYVRVPLGKRDTPGVVWTLDGKDNVDPAKLKNIQQKFAFEPMPQVHRQFLEWVARYTMSDLGAVLKMSLSVPEALQPPKTAVAYTLSGKLPEKLPASRKRIVDLLKDGVPRRAADISREAGCGAALIRSMAAAGFLEARAAAAPAPCREVSIDETPLSFSKDQQAAAEALRKLAGGEPVFGGASRRRDGLGQDRSLF
jgi:primosomal protein N' (replication factor Y) (superfamily II helicase)